MVPAPRSDAPTLVDSGVPASDRPPSAGAGRSRTQATGGWGESEVDLEPGTVLAGRYEVLTVLGTGGMGSVYKAQDRELERLVALKVIRPELARNAAIVDRFKQEIRLSHKVTHRNVVRMYDLSEDAGMRFVTMELVAGRDLRSVLEDRGKMPPDEAVRILQQICTALEAAHSAGILHRDLKPQNVMVEDAGRVVVMDFGLARTIEGDGMTQSGALLGTMEYMSPEQALGKELDQRSDIFALGLIGYEMLTGDMPFKAESAIASLLKRTRERAAPISQLDATLPGALTAIIGRCLETDVEQRYRSVGEILKDLEQWREKTAAASLRFTANVPSQGISGRWLLVIGGGVLATALAAGIPIAVHHFRNSPAAGAGAVAKPSISLAILPFYNASGNTSLDWLSASMAEMLGTDIGQSAQVRMVSGDRLEQVLKDLHVSANSQPDPGMLHRVAEFTNAQTLIYGQYIQAGNQIRITTTVRDLAHDTQSSVTTDVPDQNQLLASVDKLAADLRQKLSTDPKVLNDLKAHAVRPTTTSVDALRAYEAGVALERDGKDLDAQQQLQTATTADPNFALAFAKLADAYSNLGHDDLAQTASRRAVELSENLPAQERYLIEADNARINHNTQKAIDAYQQLAAADPSDTDVQFVLAGLYEQQSNYKAAKQKLAMVLANDPKNVEALLASGRVDIEADDPQSGLDVLSRALPLATELDNQEEKATILQATGIAYDSMNRPDDALRNYQESLAIKKQIGDQRGEAASLEQIAYIDDKQGKTDEALAMDQQALALRRQIRDQAGIGNSLIDIGTFYHDHAKPEDALKNYMEALQIERQLGDPGTQALCLQNIGSIKMDQGAYQESLTYLEQAYALRQKLNVPDDLADSLHNLAEVNVKLGQYDTALSDYLKAIETYRGANDQRGVAVEDNGMAKIFAAQGRYGAALAAMKEALNILQQSKETTSLTVEVVGGWGNLQAQVGHAADGRASLEQALHIAQQIQNNWAAALATNWIGDAYFYQGDYANAHLQYDHALEIASKTADKETILVSKVNRAKTDLAMGHAAAVIPDLKKLAQDADAAGLKSLSVECAFYLDQALAQTRGGAAAQQDLSLTLARAENLGLRILQAKIQALQGTLLAGNGRASDAAIHDREAVRILDAISKEDNSAQILNRADLKRVYADAQKGLAASH
ncbi:MAG TPA: tetratricopeptide repeat protein [Acidobacteriaceae bacterium]|jgi:tetratricopeptide (TPR) repeat protein/tRNA A-37 threonylcarbamoyl transferase component Bud32|nr:tetratricopeptide repeat protein [Acidobacteriaceae bacterium]